MREEHNVTVIRPQSWHRDAKTWCILNVGRDWWSSDEGDWTWINFGSMKDGSGNEKLVYSFNDESKAIEFALKWK